MPALKDRGCSILEGAPRKHPDCRRQGQRGSITHSTELSIQVDEEPAPHQHILQDVSGPVFLLAKVDSCPQHGFCSACSKYSVRTRALLARYTTSADIEMLASDIHARWDSNH